MKCYYCSRDLPENEIQESHDIPCYMFKGKNRAERKNQADKFGRHYLCKICHEAYEEWLRTELQPIAIIFARKYFK